MPIRSEWPTCAEPLEAVGPVVASMVGVIRVSAAVPLRSRKNFVLKIGGVSPMRGMSCPCSLRADRREQIAAALRLDERVSVKFAKVRGNNGVLRLPQLRERPVEPGPGADAVTRVDGGLSGASLSAGDHAPCRGVTARAHSGRKLAGASAPASPPRFPPLPIPTLVTKKGHSCRSRRRATGGRRDALSVELSRRLVLLSQHQARGQHQGTQDGNVSVWPGHGFVRHPS